MAIAAFASEAELVKTGKRIIREVLVPVAGTSLINTRYEVPAPGGVPDLIIFTKHGNAIRYVVTIEFKLNNWRRAIMQAFRYRNFGNEAYVVLDQASASAALSHIDHFERANVGLLTISRHRELRALHLPKPHLPFSETFSVAFAKALLMRKFVALTELPYIRSTRGGLQLAQLRSHLSKPPS